MNTEHSFGDWLRQRRRALDLTQEELAAQVGCSAITLRKLEAESRRPSKQIAERLAEVLHVPIGDREAFLRFARGDPFAAPGAVKSQEQTNQQAALRHNLPLQLTSFIGRETDIKEIRRSLTPTPKRVSSRLGVGEGWRGSAGVGVRLLTLTGAGGSGKTRLALEVAGGLLDQFPDGVWLVELASLADPALVPQNVAVVLGLREVPGRPLIDVVLDDLRHKQLLLVLDNCEHLIGACAELAERLLRACPQLAVLATSREALSIWGERVYLVPTLASPSARDSQSMEALAQYEAARLFIDRAQAAQLGLKMTNANAPAIAQICRRLDGIPLALELAAARVKVLGVDEIATRLADRFQLLAGGSRTALPRHQTLLALTDWSYDLLTEPERILFRRLSVFAGGWTLAAAEAIGAGDDLESTAMLGLLARLVSKSLVMTQPEASSGIRYGFLETIRQYAGEKLVASDDAEAVRRRHADYYLALAQKGAFTGNEPPQPGWLKRLLADEDNLRVALAWSRSAAGTAEIGLRLAALMYVYGGFRGYWTERREWVEQALARGDTERLPALRAQVLSYVAHSLAVAGQYAAAEVYLAQSLALYQGLGDLRNSADMLEQLGWLAREQGDAASAHRWLEQSVALFRRLDEPVHLAIALNTLAEVFVMEEDAAGAARLLEEALTLHRWTSFRDALGWSLNHLGHVAQLQGAFDKAAQLHEESIGLFREASNLQGIGSAHQSLGEIALAQGNRVRAATNLTEALQTANSADPVFRTWCLAGLAGVAMLDEELERAAQLWGAAEALRQSIGARPAPATRATRERLMALARAQLGQETFAAAWAEGEKLTMDEAVALALQPGAMAR